MQPTEHPSSLPPLPLLHLWLFLSCLTPPCFATFTSTVCLLSFLHPSLSVSPAVFSLISVDVFFLFLNITLSIPSANLFFLSHPFFYVSSLPLFHPLIQFFPRSSFSIPLSFFHLHFPLLRNNILSPFLSPFLLYPSLISYLSHLAFSVNRSIVTSVISFFSLLPFLLLIIVSLPGSPSFPVSCFLSFLLLPLSHPSIPQSFRF